mmetsp:Transcript_24120/g.21439  ORF Transcript_24120/g.21439 Transcript_24120/m.21439 type:complete len:84 (+) Transcript_24120:11-262(+)
MSNKNNLFLTQTNFSQVNIQTTGSMSMSSSLPSLQKPKSKSMIKYSEKIKEQMERIKKGDSKMMKASHMYEQWTSMRDKVVGQ